MATSPNFSWPEPDNTDLVKNGALAIRTAVDAIDNSLYELKGGTTGQILSKTSNTDMDFTWITNDVGDITAVTAGSGLSGGGTSGAVSLALDLASANVFTAAQTATRFIVTGSTVATNGVYLPAANSLGLSTNSTERIRIDSAGSVSIGGTPSGNVLFTITGTPPVVGLNSHAVLSNCTFNSASTTGTSSFYSLPSTSAVASTITTFAHYRADNITLGATSAVTNQYGYSVPSSLTSGTNNFGFYSNIASTANRWNFYANGTAANYFAGRTGVGILLTSSAQFGVTNVQSATDVTFISRNFAAQTAESWAIQNSAGSTIYAVTAAGLMRYISGNTATTVGAAGGASALPLTPTGYLKVDIGGTEYKVPYYAA